MRLIGHLPNASNAATFSQFLQIQGITNELEQEPEGWAVWVHSEDEHVKAADHFQKFLGNPQHPQFHIAALTAPREKTRVPASDQSVAAADIDIAPEELPERSAEPLSPATTQGMGPLTLAVVVACIGIGIVSRFGEELNLLQALFLTNYSFNGFQVSWTPGLAEIKSGELWRLVTPILVHNGFFHLLMNLMCFIYFASQIESRERTGKLLALVLVTAVLSNLGEYWLSSPFFGGLSGVVYGLLGYIWMKFRFEPESGYFVNLMTVTILLVWYFICLIGLVPNIANGAHTFGLLTGLGWGLMSAKWATRRRVQI